MTNDKFNEILERRIDQIRATLGRKAGEYAAGGDRLHNFKVAARVMGTTPEKALMGMLLNHFVSVLDLVDVAEAPSLPMADEKVGDLINYLCLLEALWVEQRAAHCR